MSLVGFSGLVALIRKYHRICILSRILTLSTQQDFQNIQNMKFAFSTDTTKFKEKKFATSSRSGIKFLVPIQSCQI